MPGGFYNLRTVALPFVRSDGRNYPLGSKLATFTAGPNTLGGLIAAPGAGLHIMLKSLVVYATVPSGAQMSIVGTIDGNTSFLVQPASTPAGSSVQEWESGILLDENTAVSYGVSNTAAAFMAGSALYDVVS